MSASRARSSASSASSGSSSGGKRQRVTSTSPQPPCIGSHVHKSKRARLLHETYKRVGTIAEGQYGVVFKATPRAGRGGTSSKKTYVALKQLKTHDLEEGFPVTAVREVAALKSLSSPYVIKLLEVVVGETMDEVFMALEYHPHDLKVIIESRGSDAFTPAQAKTLVWQLMSGLAYLHSSWYIHRDIKPGNLLYSADGRLIIADLGLVRPYGDPPPSSLTPKVVTLWYRAPELLFGAPAYTTAIDLWSAGAVLVELITGSPLIKADSETAYVHKMCLLLGSPSDAVWPAFSSLPEVGSYNLPDQHTNYLSTKLPPWLSDVGSQLAHSLLRYDPDERATAETALASSWFTESPAMVEQWLMPSFS